MSNALKNTPPRGNITINLIKHNNSIDIIIIDTGVGFKEEEKEKLFKKFGKIERYGKRMNIIAEGYDLGLYIAKEIVYFHDEMIWLKSEGRNKGTKVTKLSE